MKSAMSSTRQAIFAAYVAVLLLPAISAADDKPAPLIPTNQVVINGAPARPKDAKDLKVLKNFEIQLQYPDPANPGQVTTTKIKVSVKSFDELTETQLQAQDRKAVAIDNAINNAGIKEVKAELVTEYYDKKTDKMKKYDVPIVLYNPITNSFYQKWVPGRRIKVTGLAVNPNDKPGQQRKKLFLFFNDETGEVKGKGITTTTEEKKKKERTFPDEIPVPSSGSMDGKRSGLSTGDDGSGHASVFSFGLHSDADARDYIATMVGASNMTDSEILTELASRFNSLFSDCGYTAYYDATNDRLTFDRPLDPSLVFVEFDNDSGIQFDAEFDLDLDQAGLQYDTSATD